MAIAIWDLKILIREYLTKFEYLNFEKSFIVRVKLHFGLEIIYGIKKFTPS